MISTQTPNMEDYLKAIASLCRDEGVARVSHIGKLLGVTMPSVSSATKKLVDEGLVEHERYGHVFLTPRGATIAEDIISRHEALVKFLSEILGVDSETAEKDGCNMEHYVSPQTQDRLSKFVEFVLASPKGVPEWLGHFQYFIERGEHPKECLDRSPRGR